MENLLVFQECGNLLLTLSLRPLNNDYLTIRAGDCETLSVFLLKPLVGTHYHHGIREHHEGTAPQSEAGESPHISEQLSDHGCFSLHHLISSLLLRPPRRIFQSVKRRKGDVRRSFRLQGDLTFHIFTRRNEDTRNRHEREARKHPMSPP